MSEHSFTSDFHSLKKPKNISPRNTLYYSTRVFFYKCSLLLLILLFQAFVLDFVFRAPSKSVSSVRHDLQVKASQLESQKCEYGMVYVYDLPPMFNQELLDNCRDLDPWHSRCNAISNHGLGPKVTGLSGVPENLVPAWYWTDMFAGEVIYHARILKHKCRTTEPGLATAFYVPFYAGLAVAKYLFTNYTAKQRDWHCEGLLNWVQDQPPWRRSNGSDHFIMLGRMTWDFRRSRDEDWGSSFIHMPLMKRVLRLGVERDPWDQQEISDQCYNESSSCRVVDCSGTRCYDGTSEILESFLASDFCLQPRGDAFTRRSTFDCMLAGSIPVFFWKRSIYRQYQWFLGDESEKFSVFIDRKDIRKGMSVRKVLEGYSGDEVRKMRENIISLIPKFVYSISDEVGSTKDAFDLAIDGVLKRFQKQKGKKIGKDEI
ncbi:UNVERIFIED_CONTAM: Xyloglucan galactosyltransferase XLT2 [Sesamum radiatum]|uniref:Xyloglucan galactosyltransferase XLT2 n=1 Tax=Sesamum radiatum TaxID=300843 RepID=A0AAW2P3C8_SESRA